MKEPPEDQILFRMAGGEPHPPYETMMEAMRALPGDTMNWNIERGTIEEGRSFSKSAMEELKNQMMLWVGSRVAERWEATGEPPTAMTVTLTVKVG